jgi:hypothetical protein
MQVQLGHHDWRVLRHVLRNRGRPVPGKELRLEMSRGTKDGSFLTNLVRHGLLAVAAEGNTPFDSTFRLTALGKHAAEYGVYEVDWATLKALKDGPEGRAGNEPGRSRRTTKRPARRATPSDPA